ncbi:unnamed protein product (macronuclear) [Paramecium tetraurelia]|uniref:HPt domain-containing protein n=1 Tax=Paramecium tetraurelia TaxID=5888 RepID=A0BPT9_PARTE|nr:uncharacterized protein GSPATT00005306001 [Paramecium tetraurelia]CAK60556.1 unnamed protein product [Paramecium tetraurelia]|eukprot:XP_001427954.1 hypothetical protein (macronuclear) [Paramecium tetraurelia strain d4-2]
MDYKTINYEQGKIEYGSEEIYVSIISKFINMTFEKQLQELYLAVQLLDQKRVERACFVLKGSVGQILAFDYLQKTNALYDIAKKQQPHTDRDIIDLYHRYFDLIDASIQLAGELSTAAKKLNHIVNLFTIDRGYHLAKRYIQEYSKPSDNQQRCQQCKECVIF